jgi:hypothetical protein
VSAVELTLYGQVALTRDLPDLKLKAGDVATFVDLADPANPGSERGCVLEVFNAIGETAYGSCSAGIRRRATARRSGARRPNHRCKQLIGEHGILTPEQEKAYYDIDYLTKRYPRAGFEGS